MQIQSSRFGSIEVCDKNILEFAEGLPGFPEERSFAFIPHDINSPFAFLQSLHNGDLTFLIVDPFGFFPDYEFKLEDETTSVLNLSVDTPAQVVNIVTIPEKTDDMTANLLAPIIINRKTQQARQIILEKTAYETKHKLFPQGLPKKQEQGGK